MLSAIHPKRYTHLPAVLKFASGTCSGRAQFAAASVCSFINWGLNFERGPSRRTSSRKGKKIVPSQASFPQLADLLQYKEGKNNALVRVFLCAERLLRERKSEREDRPIYRFAPFLRAPLSREESTTENEMEPKMRWNQSLSFLLRAQMYTISKFPALFLHLQGMRFLKGLRNKLLSSSVLNSIL